MFFSLCSHSLSLSFLFDIPGNEVTKHDPDGDGCLAKRHPERALVLGPELIDPHGGVDDDGGLDGDGV